MSGALKDTAGKARLDLLSTLPLIDIAAVREFGAAKYEDWDWQKGRDWLDYYAAILRHLFAWHRGEDSDPESGLPHLAHAAAGLMFLMEFAHTGAGRDNRPPRAEVSHGEGERG